jgi:hypothetical protein
MDLTRVKCDNCGNDGGDNCLVLIKDVVGQILIGMRPDGSLVGVAEQDRQVAWCSACGETTTLITIEEDEDEDLPD